MASDLAKRIAERLYVEHGCPHAIIVSTIDRELSETRETLTALFPFVKAHDNPVNSARTERLKKLVNELSNG